MDATEAAVHFAKALQAVPCAIGGAIKDLVDVERLLGLMKTSLDCVYGRAALVEVVGADDYRTRKWDELVGQLVAVP